MEAATGSRHLEDGIAERRMIVNFRGQQAEQRLSADAVDAPVRPASGAGISRRALFRYGSATAVIAGVGLAGLLELLENREAIAAGMELGLHGITREPD